MGAFSGGATGVTRWVRRSRSQRALLQQETRGRQAAGFWWERLHSYCSNPGLGQSTPPPPTFKLAALQLHHCSLLPDQDNATCSASMLLAAPSAHERVQQRGPDSPRL